MRKKFGVLGDCVFLADVEDYDIFLDDFLGEFDSVNFDSDVRYRGRMDIRSGFSGQVYSHSIRGYGSSSEKKRQSSVYNRGIVLGGSTENWIETFFDIGDFLVERNIPFCLPRTIGEKYFFVDRKAESDLIVSYFSENQALMKPYNFQLIYREIQKTGRVFRRRRK